jgi:hypothetical protein
MFTRKRSRSQFVNSTCFRSARSLARLAITLSGRETFKKFSENLKCLCVSWRDCPKKKYATLPQSPEIRYPRLGFSTQNCYVIYVVTHDRRRQFRLTGFRGRRNVYKPAAPFFWRAYPGVQMNRKKKQVTCVAAGFLVSLDQMEPGLAKRIHTEFLLDTVAFELAGHDAHIP